MKVYISGAISKDPNYKEKFKNAETQLRKLGYKVLSPTMIYEVLTWEEYMKIDYAMIDVCDVVYFLKDWQESPGAKTEYEYAKSKNKILYTQDLNNLSKIKL